MWDFSIIHFKKIGEDGHGFYSPNLACPSQYLEVNKKNPEERIKTKSLRPLNQNQQDRFHEIEVVICTLQWDSYVRLFMNWIMEATIDF